MQETTTPEFKDIYTPVVAWIVKFITAHAMIWFIVLVVLVLIIILNLILRTLPQWEVIKSQILLPLSKIFKHRSLVKEAIQSDIKGHVNLEVKELQKYLPSGWIKQIDIQWVSSEKAENFIEDNRVVLRLRPVKSQNRNFVNATYHFLKQIMFPKTNTVIPEGHLEGTIVYLCRKIVNKKGHEATSIFEDEILEPAIQSHKHIPKYLEDYEILDNKGFFTGTFLREMHLVARQVRFKPQRYNMGNEAAGIISHIKSFIEKFQREDDIPSSVWYNISTVSRYGLLLVAHPEKTSSGIDPYLKRVKEKFDRGITRVYIFGTKTQEGFFKAVIQGVVGTIPNCELIEEFIISKDYRGNPDGLGAVFVKKEENVSEKLHIPLVETITSS